MNKNKYKAWNKKHKFMDTVWLIDWEHEIVCHSKHNKSDLKDCVLLQYTGLQDANNKEIYEGDIVSAENYITHMDNYLSGAEIDVKDKTYGIRFERGSFRLYDFSTDNWVAIIDHHTVSKVDKIQVIGNIYNNPELLEDNND